MKSTTTTLLSSVALVTVFTLAPANTTEARFRTYPPGGPLWLSSSSSSSSSSSKAALPVVTKRDHVRGQKNATVIAVVYSDYQCPFCQRHYATMRSLLSANRKKLQWVMRHYPLAFHQNAMPAAEAAECAASLGGDMAFWSFSDAMMTGTGNFAFATIAKDIGLEAKTFATCLEKHTFQTFIDGQRDAGTKAGVRGTPMTFFLNVKTGRLETVSGAMPLEQMQSALNKVLQ